MLVQFFLWLSFFISLSLIFIDTILMVGVFCLIFSLLICCLVSVFFSSWFSVVAVVVYVGGLLVMFSYFLAICPNQPLGGKGWSLFSSFMLSLIMIFYICVLHFPESSNSLTEVEYLYTTNEGLLLIFLVIMLLLALFAVVSVVSLSQGPLRPFSRGS